MQRSEVREGMSDPDRFWCPGKGQGKYARRSKLLPPELFSGPD